MAYARAEEEIQKLVEVLKIPFLTSPMGKGTISDDHKNCVTAARSLALSEADVIFFAGARINWMFNFGQTPGISKNTKIIQLDISAEELQTNRRVDVPLNGDAKAVLTQLLERAVGLSAPINTRESWWGKLRSKCEQNIALLDKKVKDKSQPLKYHYVLSTISKYLPRDAIIINEGANTMDIGRVTLANHLPRTRLDAGTLGTMGVGAGYAIASAVSFPNRKVVAVVGDSAFGFSGFETEVAVRYDLPITFFVINNNGIYCGESELKTRNPTQLLPTSLTPNTRYDLIMTAFGGTGYYVTDAAQLEEIIPKSLSCSGPSLVNIIIDSQGPTPSIVNSKK